jgi:uncharacterized OB-fold protein
VIEEDEMAEAVNFPRPLPDFDAQEFWDGCNQNELFMQRCKECKKLRWLPRPMCPQCNSLEREWVKMSGKGKVFSWTIVTHPVHPAATSKVPYNVTQVQLDEDPEIIMVTNLVGIKNEEIRMDLPVKVVFEEHEPGVKIPKFTPI